MKVAVRIRVRFAWRLTWLYLPGIQTLVLLGFDPDLEKAAAIAKKAIRVEVVPVTGVIAA